MNDVNDENKLSLTVASFNIGSAHMRQGRYTAENLASVCEATRACGAQIVGMQEVDRGCRRSDGVDMPAHIAREAGYPYYHFIVIRPFQGGEYGTLILSKYPVGEARTVNFNLKTATQGTSCGYVRLRCGARRLTVFNTHLSCESTAANRETMAELGRILREYRAANPGEPVICTGDFNEFPAVLRGVIPDMATTAETERTYKHKTIDNVLRSEGVTAEDVRTVDCSSDGTSDHNMLLCRITF